MAVRRTGRPARGGGARVLGRTGLRAAIAAALVLAPLSLGTPPATAAVPGSGPVATDEVTPTPAVVVTQVTPTAVGVDDDVTVSALLTNTTDEPLEAAHAHLGVVRYRLSSREALRGWAAGEVTTLVPTPVADVDLDEPLAPGASRSVTFEVPASDLRLLPYPESSGVRGLVVTLADDARGQVGEGRGFLTWAPSGDADPVRLSILVPVTGPAPDPTDLPGWTTQIASETAVGGRLERIVAGTAGTRNVSWVVDPALVEQAASGTPETVAWSTALLAGAAGRDVFATDRYDPDLAALAAADVAPLADDREPPVSPEQPDDPTDDGETPADDPVGAARRAAGSWRTDLALPASGTASSQLLEAAARVGRRLVVVDDGLAGTGPTTAPGSTTVPTAAGDVTALVPDTRLDELFVAATSALDPTLPAAVASATRSHDLLLLLAELATVAEEPVATLPHLVVATDRDWSPDPTALAHVLSTLGEDRLVDLVPVSTLAGTPQAAASRDPLPVSATPVASLRPSTVALAWGRVGDIRKFAEVTPDPGLLSAGPAATTSAALSVAWGDRRPDRVRLLEAARDEVEEMLAGISVVAGSDINLISDHGNLPIRIRNDLPVSIAVGVALVPDDPRLNVLDVPQATLEPGTEQSVEVPVRAIGSGDVRVLVRLTGPDGVVVAEPYAFDVRVRAEWETVGTAVIAGLLALLVLGGVVRTIRRGRSARRTAPIRPMEDA
ncbi:DUF6049 family protein [Sanguibacter sp. HDW7]|uniref:DUF6049 family protein n=1 Tax=Sanguibacter sp. HDW7 TaxID=2714931 RepID=UPI00140BDDAB|nr:DUF6049 family protein [Sanguibacter sp. HDW7]QIK84741.1 hypothetical protein G7063_14830 [Sanguibacter sp. HDW7]